MDGISSLSVFDANSKLVGYVASVTSHGGAIVPFAVGGRTTILRITRDEIMGSTSPSFFFASTDCSGTPLIGFEPPTLFTRSVVVDGMLYLPDLEGSVQMIEPGPHSQISFDRDSSCQSVTVMGGPSQHLALVPVLDLASEFTPPFSIR